MNKDGVDIKPAAELVNRPVNQCAQSRGRSTTRLTGVHKRTQDSAHDSSVDRSVDRSRRMVDRPVDHSVDHIRRTVDRLVDRLT